MRLGNPVDSESPRTKPQLQIEEQEQQQQQQQQRQRTRPRKQVKLALPLMLASAWKASLAGSNSQRDSRQAGQWRQERYQHRHPQS